MPKLKAIHQLVVNGDKPTDKARVIEPGQPVTVSAEDAERFISLGAAVLWDDQEAQAAEEARLAAEAQAAEEARLAAEAQAAEEARLAAEAQAAEEARLAAKQGKSGGKDKTSKADTAHDDASGLV